MNGEFSLEISLGQRYMFLCPSHFLIDDGISRFRTHAHVQCVIRGWQLDNDLVGRRLCENRNGVNDPLVFRHLCKSQDRERIWPTQCKTVRRNVTKHAVDGAVAAHRWCTITIVLTFWRRMMKRHRVSALVKKCVEQRRAVCVSRIATFATRVSWSMFVTIWCPHIIVSYEYESLTPGMRFAL